MAANLAGAGTDVDRRAWPCARGARRRRPHLAALAAVAGLLADLAARDRFDGTGAAEVRAHMAVARSLAEAVSGAAWVRASAPNDSAIKHERWRKLDQAAGPNSSLVSATSAPVPWRS